MVHYSYASVSLSGDGAKAYGVYVCVYADGTQTSLFSFYLQQRAKRSLLRQCMQILSCFLKLVRSPSLFSQAYLVPIEAARSIFL